MGKNLFKVSKITSEQRSSERCSDVILLTLNRFLPTGKLANLATRENTSTCCMFPCPRTFGYEIYIAGLEITNWSSLWRRDFSAYFQPGRLKICWKIPPPQRWSAVISSRVWVTGYLQHYSMAQIKFDEKSLLNNNNQ